MDTRGVELLILDFAGVCTPSASELITSGSDTSAISIRPECEAVVSAAQAAGITVAILSNEISRDWADDVPLLSTVDHVVACSDNNIFKPDRRAFQRCLLLTGAEAERTLVVDDSSDNITVASSLGMQTVLFDASDPTASWQEVRDAIT